MKASKNPPQGQVEAIIPDLDEHRSKILGLAVNTYRLGLLIQRLSELNCQNSNPFAHYAIRALQGNYILDVLKIFTTKEHFCWRKAFTKDDHRERFQARLNNSFSEKSKREIQNATLQPASEAGISKDDVLATLVWQLSRFRHKWFAHLDTNAKTSAGTMPPFLPAQDPLRLIVDELVNASEQPNSSWFQESTPSMRIDSTFHHECFVPFCDAMKKIVELGLKPADNDK